MPYLQSLIITADRLFTERIGGFLWMLAAILTICGTMMLTIWDATQPRHYTIRLKRL